MELLDDIGISEHPSDQPPLKYPLSETGGDKEELNIFTYLGKLPAAILQGKDPPWPFLPLTVLQFEHIIIIIFSASFPTINVYLIV